MNLDMVNVLLLPETNLLDRFPELEQKVDYFLYDWDEYTILLTYNEVTRQIKQKQKDQVVKKLVEDLDVLIRSQNVLWRSWKVNKNGPEAKYPPEKINWNKDADYIFLYGPIYKNSIELPWCCRSPTLIDGVNLKSALKRSAPLSLLGTPSPPSLADYEKGYKKSNSVLDYSDYLVNIELERYKNSNYYNSNQISFQNSKNHKSIDNSPQKKHTHENLANGANSTSPIKSKKPKLRFNKQVEQCMVVFRQEEELLPTDFEDYDDDDSIKTHSLSDINIHDNINQSKNVNILTSQKNRSIASSNKKHDPNSPEDDSISTEYDSNSHVAEKGVLSTFFKGIDENDYTLNSNTHLRVLESSKSDYSDNSDYNHTSRRLKASNGSSNVLHKQRRKGRNRSTFVIKLAPTSLKDSSSVNEQPGFSTFTGLGLRRKLFKKSVRNKNSSVTDISIDSDSDADSQGSWLWNRFGLSSPNASPIPNSDAFDQQQAGILSTSPTKMISNLSESVHNVISSNWTNLWNPNRNNQPSTSTQTSPVASSSSSTFEPPDGTKDQKLMVDSETKKDKAIDISLDSTYLTLRPSGTDLQRSSSNSFDFLMGEPSFSNIKSPIDPLDTFNETEQVILNKSSASMLWPSIKESSEILLDNAEDRIATTVDAVKWLSSFFSNYNPF
ncbi:hypothetical protein BB559_001588 [Furculomyces boomerangus]|uniref:Nitrogen regulatory protein areA GATA-like domain-containing protein n=1 Tax=Furculomyces boomerangus TaxID=61424 RepID=A0A2T9XYF6_9FUNG|nr:hypothetical protein BB559_007185 [Furculomyces boomerangus]PVU98423.1 hypothetical protein BB559_001588 [Furculomyces boomerangus]